MTGLWDRLVSGKDKAAFEAEKLRQITALQGQIRGLQKEIEQAFATLGATTYRLYSEGQVREPELQQACASLAGLQGQIDTLAREIETIRLRQFQETGQQGHECPNGHGRLPAQNRFCHICGAEAVLVAPAHQQTTFCTRCGSAIPAGSSFCSGCGAAMEAPQIQPAYGAPPGPLYNPPPPAPPIPPARPEAEGRTADLSAPGQRRTCPNCSAAAEEPNQWCIYCGAALDNAAAATPGGGATVLLPETDSAPPEPPVSSATTLLPETLLADASNDDPFMPPEDNAEQGPPDPGDVAGDEAAKPASNVTTLLPETALAYLDEENEPEPVEPADRTSPLSGGGGGESGREYESGATRLLPETELEALSSAVQDAPDEGAKTTVISTASRPPSACPACGAAAVPGNVFCTDCGHALAA